MKTAIIYVSTHHGNTKKLLNASAKKITDARNCECLGTYFCKGFDTFGPFKLIGGINKNRPDQSDIDGAVKFYKGIQ